MSEQQESPGQRRRPECQVVSADDLETMAFAAHAPIEPPGPEGGWATATINGHLYKARVAPVPVTEGEDES